MSPMQTCETKTPHSSSLNNHVKTHQPLRQTKPFGDLPSTPAKRNGNTSASRPYQLTTNNQNMPNMASTISPTSHTSQRNQAFMTSPPLPTKHSTHNSANQPIQMQKKGQAQTRTTAKHFRIEKQNSSKTSKQRSLLLVVSKLSTTGDR